MTSHGYKQNEISQELSMGTKIFKTSYRTVLRAFSFKSATFKALAIPVKYGHANKVIINNTHTYKRRL